LDSQAFNLLHRNDRLADLTSAFLAELADGIRKIPTNADLREAENGPKSGPSNSENQGGEPGSGG